MRMAATDQTRSAPLSASTIVDAALEIADEKGLEAVTMRAVGARLGAAAMSLYRHVPNKDALLELMADRVLAELPYPRPEGDWRAEIHAFYMTFHDLLLEHPAVAHVMIEMALAGPELSLRGENLLACMLDAGFDPPTAAQMISAFTWHTVGGSLYAIARRNPAHEDRDLRLRDLPPEQFPSVHRVAPYLADDASREGFADALWHLIRGYEPGESPGGESLASSPGGRTREFRRDESGESPGGDSLASSPGGHGG